MNLGIIMDKFMKKCNYVNGKFEGLYESWYINGKKQKN